ncbi:conserved hypothetical protein [Desulfamplus magnetovallimortis]|uniref:RNA 2',3'-cyclic phosphodiesterase n=1 Tax=Desulfamplus magnetovallimortis TaxID=1246637 RepID=A0A1W1HAI5_9BACT|nr:RNA 2',3'-cyclic phosphodiesterase [Desulfamplus magnetovallimortis]SLM29490.1 conserved hypothetical protein [Desulfamplus magnetovallimortis]
MPATGSFRAFIAISLPDSIVLFLQKLQSDIRTKFPDITGSWTKTDSMHLTLSFLGNIHMEQVANIKAAMNIAASQAPSCKLFASGCGVFPSVKKAGVLWSGLKGDTMEISNLHSNLTTILERRGFPRERRSFRPHLTMCRLKKEHDPLMLAQLIKSFQNEKSLSFRCKTIDLFRSDLKPSGAVHTLVYSAPLSGR